MKIVVLFILLSMSAMFSCSETAFFSLTRAQIHRLKNSKKGYHRLVISVLKHSREILITILMGNEFVNVAFAIVVASLIYNLMGPVGWKLSTLVSVAVSVPSILVFGEIVPKNIAVRLAPSLVPFLVFPIRFFSTIVFPLRVPITKFADAIVKLFGGDPRDVGSMIREEEFRQLVDMGYREGVLEEVESELIHRVFELGNKDVGEIMTPEGKIFRLSIDKPLDQIVKEIRAAQYSRVPVYRNYPDDIIGTLHSRDVLRLYRMKLRGHAGELEEIIRPVPVVQKDTSLESLLLDFQKLKIHMAIVVEKGRLVGLITMDDIFQLLFAVRVPMRKGEER